MAVVDDVSDTARWVAHFRALESERADAIFRDPLARRLAGERGRRIAETLPKLSLEWVIPVRAKVYDELIVAVLDRGVRAKQDSKRTGSCSRPVTTVLNLAAGLDTRPYRLAEVLPESLRWIEVDLPEILDFKTEALKEERPACRLERIALDLTDRAALHKLLARLVAENESVLVVTEGLLAYLDESEVASLSRSLFDCPAIDAWILEVTLPEVLKQAQRAWSKTLAPARAQMKSAVPLKLFEDHGWHPRTTRSLLEEAQRLHREMPLVGLKRFVSILLRGRETWRRMAMYAVMNKPDGARYQKGEA